VNRIDVVFEQINKIEHRINMGRYIRNIHVEFASYFFLIIYLHMVRGIIYISYYKQEVWNTGITILILLIAIAFLGYVLVMGRISFWGSIVITNFFSVIPLIGNSLVQWMWGGYIVNDLTLKFFFSLHFLLPFVLLVLVLLHLLSLHFYGSRTPTNQKSFSFKLSFSFLFASKDFLNLFMMLFIIFITNILIVEEPENSMIVNIISSPIHIKPEWYFFIFLLYFTKNSA